MIRLQQQFKKIGAQLQTEEGISLELCTAKFLSINKGVTKMIRFSKNALNQTESAAGKTRYI